VTDRRQDRSPAHEFRNALNAAAVNLEALRARVADTPSASELTPLADAVSRQFEQVMAQTERLLARDAPAAASSNIVCTDASSTTPVGRAGYIAPLPAPPSPTGMTPAKILIADDEAAVASGLSAVLSGLKYDVAVESDGEAALARLAAEPFGLVLADFKMPKLDGLALLKALQQREIPTECIIITGQATVDSAVDAMHNGAYDYIEKPLNAEKLARLKALIPKALDKYAVRQRNRELSYQLEGLTRYAELTGSSEPMREVYGIIDAVAPTTASVLIFGESGTGKELVARALHSKSERSTGPFFALNCAALPKEILENELFGHEKGAFTGSTNEKPGAFEMSSGGTLFLDEVAEMPTDIQVKLLRALESRTVRRLGGKKEIAVDIRVVAATNRDLQQALAKGDIREDLYYRLAVVEMFIPPLRERVSDIPLLANEFLARFAHQNGKAITGFDDTAMEWIMTYGWPGNVRDLKNAVERAVVLARGTVITRAEMQPRLLRPTPDSVQSVTVAVGSSAQDARRQLVLKTLASTGGDFERASKMLGMGESEIREDLAAIVKNGRVEPTHVPTDPPLVSAAEQRASAVNGAKKTDAAANRGPAAKKTQAKRK
jgi:DNA-binding NtrC family response regulator